MISFLRPFVLTFFVLGLFAFAPAQNNYGSVFQDLINQGKWSSVPSLLAQWRSASPSDPELFIAEFNYYFHESRSEAMQLSQEPPTSGEAITILDSITSEPVGYMYSAVIYDEAMFQKALDAVDAGIRLYPTRLDMHMGRIFVLGEKGDMGAFVTHVVKLIELHATYHNEWLWKQNAPAPNIDELFTGAVQEHCFKLFNMDQPDLNGVEQISVRMTQLYPADVRFYSNIGACMLMRERYPDALSYFLLADEKLADDPIVIANIAYTYKAIDDFANARKYYERLTTIGNDEQAAFARAQLEQL